MQARQLSFTSKLAHRPRGDSAIVQWRRIRPIARTID
eukprot:COSAG01_NODE_54145_length_334_cov_0.663830_1_plen_36_part_10